MMVFIAHLPMRNAGHVNLIKRALFFYQNIYFLRFCKIWNREINRGNCGLKILRFLCCAKEGCCKRDQPLKQWQILHSTFCTNKWIKIYHYPQGSIGDYRCSTLPVSLPKKEKHTLPHAPKPNNFRSFTDMFEPKMNNNYGSVKGHLYKINRKN